MATTAPVKIMWPFRLDPSGSASFTVEDDLPGITFTMDPMLRLYNTSPADTHFKVVHLLELGPGDDPLWSGSYEFLLVDEDVLPMKLRDVELTKNIDKIDPDFATRHTVTVTNMDTVNERIVRVALFGWSVIDTQLPASQQIIRVAPNC